MWVDVAESHCFDGVMVGSDCMGISIEDCLCLVGSRRDWQKDRWTTGICLRSAVKKGK